MFTKEAKTGGIPNYLGYAIEQSHLSAFRDDILGIGFERRAGRRRVSNENEQVFQLFLHWVKTTFDPQLIYYPFSGWHTSPRDILGTNRVIHLSNDQCHSHLRDIKNGQRVMAEALKHPFREAVFDAVVLKDIPPAVDAIALFGSLRVLIKPGGLFIVNSIGIGPIIKICENELERVKVPKKFQRSKTRDNDLFLNRNKWHC